MKEASIVASGTGAPARQPAGMALVNSVGTLGGFIGPYARWEQSISGQELFGAVLCSQAFRYSLRPCSYSRCGKEPPERGAIAVTQVGPAVTPTAGINP